MLWGMTHVDPDYTWIVREIIRNHDGDTIDVRIDRGFFDTSVRRFRLYGVDTWEVSGKNAHPLGVPARDAVRAWLEEALADPGLIVRSHILSDASPISDGSFGRWGGEFFSRDGRSLNDFIRDNGHEKVT